MQVGTPVRLPAAGPAELAERLWVITMSEYQLLSVVVPVFNEAEVLPAFFERNYEPFDHDIIWRRKDIWLDQQLGGKLHLGRAPGSGLVGPGWFDPESEGEISFRRSRGRRSWLRVPIRESGNFRAIVRARLEWFAKPVSFQLSVNGTPVGRARLSRGWKDYDFLIPARLLRSGVNSFLLTYSKLPRRADPQYRDKNAVLAVEYLEMERQDQP